MSDSYGGSQRLVVFTRYPEPGKTKTRLIPGLGAEGAATVQRQMTEHMLKSAHRWQTQTAGPNDGPRNVRVLTAGGNAALFQTWLGHQWQFQSQAAGDLGDRMATAFRQGFENGSDRVVIIGIDCPDITDHLLNQAFQQLSHHDLVLGPAVDGGYYLIGLRASAQTLAIPALFEAMDWGTGSVRETTLARAHSQQLTVAQLQELTDVDYPEDLWVWEKYQQKPLNEAQPDKTQRSS